MGALWLSVFLSAQPLHTRLDTPAGAVHVLEVGRPRWTVVYVHGYETDVDAAWKAHQLEKQLQASGVEAVFIVPEAPSGPSQAVHWPSLEALLAEVERSRGIRLPREVLALGHSGAYRTLERWLGFERLTSVVLLDAFYGEDSTWDAWLEGGANRRLFVLSKETAQKAAPLCEHRSPRLECTESKWSHMEIVTSGEVLPTYVRLATGLKLKFPLPRRGEG